MAERKEQPSAEALFCSRPPASKLTPAISRRHFRVLHPLQIVPDPDNTAVCYYTDDHVRFLISELNQSSSSSCSRCRAARNLRLLAKHSPENRLRIAAAGAVPALVSTLLQLQSVTGNHRSETELQKHAVMALYNLSLHDANLPLIAASDAPSSAISALYSPGANPAARSGAACLIRRLAQYDDGGKMLEDIGSSAAVSLLVDLLRNGDLRGQKDAATALYELTSRWAANRVRTARLGLVPLLIKLIEDPESYIVEKAAYLLSAMVDADEVRAEVAKSGGVAVLVDMIDMGTREQREIAVHVLFRMCNCFTGGGQACRRVIAEEAAIPALLAIAQPGSGCSTKSRQKANVLLELLRRTTDGNHERTTQS